MKIRSFLYLLALAALFRPNEGNACGQIFVTGSDSPFGSPAFIREYTTSGALVNPALISGLEGLGRIAVADGNLFVVEHDPLGPFFDSGRIGVYTTSGETVNPALITGLTGVGDIAVSDGFLYFLNTVPNSPFGAAKISKYTTSGKLVNGFLAPATGATGIAVSDDKLFAAFPSFATSRVGAFTTSGEVINRDLLPQLGPFTPFDIAVSGENLFITDRFNPIIGEYTISGATVNPFLITGSLALNIAISGDNLFTAEPFDGRIGKYTTSGRVVNRALISGINLFSSVAVAPSSVEPVPDASSTWMLLLLGLTATWGFRLLLHKPAITGGRFSLIP